MFRVFGWRKSHVTRASDGRRCLDSSDVSMVLWHGHACRRTRRTGPPRPVPVVQSHLTRSPRDAQPPHPREVPGIARLGIPTFKITNGPAGAGPGDSPDKQPATALPSALALSATWDPAAARAFGQLAGQEVADRGENLLEAPGVNITRV